MAAVVGRLSLLASNAENAVSVNQNVTRLLRPEFLRDLAGDKDYKVVEDLQGQTWNCVPRGNR